ncbi:hypothetical protein Dfulv_02895 [Dactylosporangium fulvum]|uniref:Uncharacterized protein n=1 Tax=Dactylosporangium fulvum TaxID=53359 RepID=A0ABY5VZS9_9ACTN|nr:hypothetical protein [Dactylosporangium fulvum]UWP83268.1 hypothetical protein Dfulv_02895 [Dactylosporangium fulvum]
MGTELTTIETHAAGDLTVDVISNEPPARGRKSRLVFGAVALAAVAGVAGWQAPRVVDELTRPPYLGVDAATVAADLGCAGYTQAAKHTDAVYTYRDQGTCTINGVVVTITTFDKATDGETFAAVMEAVVPVLHPTWRGATYAAGEGWNVADARNLTPEIAELAVQRLGTGATHVIPPGAAA